MAYLVRYWIGTAAVGAGLIHLGVASRSTLPVLVLLVVVGAVEIGWGIAALARAAVPAPRLSLGGVLVPIAIQVVALLAAGGGSHMEHGSTATSSTDALPASLAGASLLDLLIAAGLAVTLRRDSSRQEAEPAPVVLLVGIAAGAAVTGLVMVNSLASVMPGGMSH